ncbi:MAG: DUF1987 domain-containing protein [Bacteroidetes bacterium]|nr:DUF1987 domain-containing protein [Bacteroidota bacterium]
MLIPQTNNTPLVVASISEGVISIKGKIIPENPDEFFHQLELITQKCAESSQNLKINLQLDYFNTPSSKMLARYFRKVIAKNPEINWYFEKNDEEIKEAGEDYASLLNFKFNFIEN